MTSRSRPISSLSLPAALLSQLTRDGYETVDDLARDRPELLSQAQASQSHSRRAPLGPPSLRASHLPSSRAVSSLISASQMQSTGCTPLDKILDGGLPPGRILEISGPPGSCKERLVLSLVRQCVKDDAGVMFVDCQNMIPPELIKRTLEDATSPLPTHLISYAKIHDAVDLDIYLRNISQRIVSCSFTPKVLVIASISFLFQPFLASNVPQSSRNAFFDRIRQALIKVSAAHNLSIITTSQLSVRLLNADGTTGNFASAVTSTMSPQIGMNYLPAGKAYRVIIVPQSTSIGKLRLLSSPRGPSLSQDKASRIEEDYRLAGMGVV